MPKKRDNSLFFYGQVVVGLFEEFDSDYNIFGVIERVIGCVSSIIVIMLYLKFLFR